MGLFEKYEETPQTGGLFDKYRQKEEKPSRLSSFIGRAKEVLTTEPLPTYPVSLTPLRGTPTPLPDLSKITGGAEKTRQAVIGALTPGFEREPFIPEEKKGFGWRILSNLEGLSHLGYQISPINQVKTLFAAPEIREGLKQRGSEYGVVVKAAVKPTSSEYYDEWKGYSWIPEFWDLVKKDPILTPLEVSIVFGGIKKLAIKFKGRTAPTAKVESTKQPFKRAEEVFPKEQVERVLGPRPKKIVVGEGVAKTTAKLKAEGVGEVKPKFKTYEEAQEAIDTRIDQLMAEGKTFKQADSAPDVVRMHEARNAIAQTEHTAGYSELTQRVNRVTGDPSLTKKILDDVYSMKPGELGPYFTAEFTAEAVSSGRAMRDALRYVLTDIAKREHGSKLGVHEIDLLFSEASGLTKYGQASLLKKATQKTKAINDVVKDFVFPKEKVRAIEPPPPAPAGKGISPKRDAELKTFADRSLDQVERGKAAGRTFVWPEAGERGPIQPRITADASTYPQWYRDLTRDYAIKKSQAIKALKEIKKKGMDADGRKYVEAVKESILDAMTEERGRYAQEILKERAKRGVLTATEKELYADLERKAIKEEPLLTEEVRAKPGAVQPELAGLGRAEAEAITGRKIKKVTGTKAIKEEMLGRPEGEVLPGQIELHAGIPIPKPIQEGIDLVTKKLFGKPEGQIEQKVWQIKRDWYYQKEGLTWKFKDKWDRELRDRFSKQERSDMMFYRQRTGNIFKKGDTFEAVESRLSKRARWFVDGEINEHIKNMRKWYNESPWTKDIVAREEVIKTYLTGVYSGNVKKGYDYLVGLKGRSFVTNNFMRNKKTYLTFDEAFRKAGLVPRFRDIADQLQYQDAYLIKNLANNELVGRLNALEKEIGTKLRITSKHHLYDEAKAQGWIPYDDPILRSYRAEKKGAAPVWATTKAPALVHPEVHSAFKDVFRKDAFKPDPKFWRGYDTATDLIRTIRVSFSGFHFVPLAESMVGGKGVGALNIPGWIKRGRTLLRDPEFMTEAIGSGLRITAPREATLQTTFSKISGLVNRLEAKGGVAKIPAKGISLAAFIPRQITHFLFHKYMPLLKVNIFMDYKHTWLKTMEKKGTKITETMRKEALTDIAKLTNDQFGAQAWTLMRTWNDPKVMKWIHRAVGYPDWTISALRQAGAGLEGGIRGKLGRRYWLRYGAAFLTAQQAMSYLNTGFYNKKDGSIAWSLDKAHSTFENKDPSHKLNFQLPDVEFTIAGKRINLGREAKYDEEGNFVGWGRLRYSHYGKQMLEIPRYATNTISQVFAKSAPLIQIGLTQVMAGKPYRGEIFPARGKFVEGEFKAWGGTRVGTKARQVERVMQLISDVLPFSVQQIRQAGPGTATLTPISKGLSLWNSRDYMEKAIKAEDPDKLRQIIEVLVDGGYSGDSIKRTITRVVNRIKKETE